MLELSTFCNCLISDCTNGLATASGTAVGGGGAGGARETSNGESSETVLKWDEMERLLRVWRKWWSCRASDGAGGGE